jgi:DNA-binding MarR family transcriptional regulator
MSPTAARKAARTNERGTSRTAYLIGRLDRALRRRITEAVAPHGLTVQQYTALSVLHSRGRLSNAQLARRSFMTPQAASELVRAMEDKGWVEREPDPVHGRILHIRLSSQGRELLRHGDAAVDRLEDQMLSELSHQQRAELHAHLSACVKALGAVYIES